MPWDGVVPLPDSIKFYFFFVLFYQHITDSIREIFCFKTVYFRNIIRLLNVFEESQQKKKDIFRLENSNHIANLEFISLLASTNIPIDVSSSKIT